MEVDRACDFGHLPPPPKTINAGGPAWAVDQRLITTGWGGVHPSSPIQKALSVEVSSLERKRGCAMRIPAVSIIRTLTQLMRSYARLRRMYQKPTPPIDAMRKSMAHCPKVGAVVKLLSAEKALWML